MIDRHRAWLVVSAATPLVSLGEGGTPVIYSPRLSGKVGRECEVFVKREGMKPTGSSKDPGVIATTSQALVEPNESAVRRALEKRWS